MTPSLFADLAGLFLIESDTVLLSGAPARDATADEIQEASRLDSIACELFARGTEIGTEV